MLTPSEIRHLAQRAYPDVQRVWLRGEPYCPVQWPIRSLPKGAAERHEACIALLSSEKQDGRPGYTIQWADRPTRTRRTYAVPTAISADTREDLLALADRDQDFTHFQRLVPRIRAAAPELEEWMAQYPHKITEHGESWDGLLKVITFLRDHPGVSYARRALPIAVDTKFIERHQRLLRELLDCVLPPEAIQSESTDFDRRYRFATQAPRIRIRGLDRQFARRYSFPDEDVTLSVAGAVALDLPATRVLVVENLHSFLALPMMTGMLAVFGSGFAVTNLGQLAWLHPLDILYWGDLDAQGMEILAHVRGHFPQTRAIGMDRATLETYQAFIVPGTPTPAKLLSYLTAEELVLYQDLQQRNQRLEQERIAMSHILAALV